MSSAVCPGCANHCRLTVNHFADGERLISGNQCQKALGLRENDALPNLFEWKRRFFSSLSPVPGTHGKLGIPLASDCSRTYGVASGA